MTPGSKYRFFIPSQLAYGDQGAGNSIGPGETLVFDVELISVEVIGSLQGNKKGDHSIPFFYDVKRDYFLDQASISAWIRPS